jgi:hypothetical protein
MREKKVRHLFDPHERIPDLITRAYRHPCSTIRVHRPIIGSLIHRPRAPFPATAICSSTYRRRNRAGLDTTVELRRGVAHLAGLDRALGPRRWCARAGGHSRRASRTLYVHLSLFLSPWPDRNSSPAGQAHLQHYTEPSAEPLLATSSTLQGTILPLGAGTFTHNTAGIPIIVACTKADLIDDNTDLVGAGASGMGGMVKGKGGEWEERTDGIMQILRTICLKCACHSFIRFSFSWRGRRRKPLLHDTAANDTQRTAPIRAAYPICTPAPSPDGALDSTAAPVRNPFPFVHKPNTLDRDRIVVPAGWDSWGKIVVLRDGFDAKAWGEAWERDLSSDAGIDSDSDDGARKMYASLVQDQGPKVRSKPPDSFPHPISSRVITHSRPRSHPSTTPTPEQDFLSKNYDENARRADRDPRGIFRTPTDASAAPAAGLVGPLGSSSFSLPTVERALAEMEGSSGATLGGLGRRAGAPTSPILGSAPSPTQHEVLQNFFKSLLNPKDRAASPGTSAVSPGAGLRVLLRVGVGSRRRRGRGRRVGVLGAVRVGVGVRRRILMRAVERKMGRMRRRRRFLKGVDSGCPLH